MNEDATLALRRAKIARLATLSARGLPTLTPLWFVFDDRCLYMNTREASPAVRNLRVNPEVVVLIEDRTGRVIRIRGSAEFTRDARIRRRTAFRAALKYWLSLGGLANLAATLGSLPARVRYYAERAGESAVIVVTPQNVELLSVPRVSDLPGRPERRRAESPSNIRTSGTAGLKSLDTNLDL